jgi:hypothetical protein
MTSGRTPTESVRVYVSGAEKAADLAHNNLISTGSLPASACISWP